MTTLEEQLAARSKWDAKCAAMLRYAYSCRNREKRAYAIAYIATLLLEWAEPSRDCYDLSYMGAQAVRLSLCDIAKGEQWTS